MLKYHFTFPVGQEKLAGTIIAADESTTPPQFVFIHGGGTAAYKEKVYDFAEPILRSWIEYPYLRFKRPWPKHGRTQKE